MEGWAGEARAGRGAVWLAVYHNPCAWASGSLCLPGRRRGAAGGGGGHGQGSSCTSIAGLQHAAKRLKKRVQGWWAGLGPPLCSCRSRALLAGPGDSQSGAKRVAPTSACVLAAPPVPHKPLRQSSSPSPPARERGRSAPTPLPPPACTSGTDRHSGQDAARGCGAAPACWCQHRWVVRGSGSERGAALMVMMR